MNEMGPVFTLAIVSFALAVIVILKKDAIPSKIRKPLATFALFMVCASFVMIVYSLFTLGLE